MLEGALKSRRDIFSVTCGPSQDLAAGRATE